MLGFFKGLLDINAQNVKKYITVVNKINELEDKVRALKDEDFKGETEKLREQFQKGKDSKDLLSWAYALVREAARRTQGMRHFDVQLIAGLALFDGKVVEQKTGEGKTLTATTALYMASLAGKGAHLVTVNDYLARRDAGWMGVIFDFLGVSTSAIVGDASYIYDSEYNDDSTSDWRLSHLKPVTRKEAYDADVTYGINSEYGFDYLRDNMAQSPDQLVQRGYYFAVVDEADSVLIDEARTPHIISAPYEEDTSKYYTYAKVVKDLKKDVDYLVDEKLRTTHLTDEGMARIEKKLGVENLYEKDYEVLFHLEAALKALVLFQNDKEYIVREGEVIIVDEFTGRLLSGRRFSEGLHQAIEAKENVEIKNESRTLATVSLQNYFRMYKKLAGMTGTAATEAEEFQKIYKTEVVVIPTNRILARRDEADVIYKTTKAKYEAVADDIAAAHKTGRPVLVGTTSIDKNEMLSKLLNKRSIKHELLNAKNHEREAQIIAQAGEKGAVTVATNMAGRGVDIILGGAQPNEEELQGEELKKALSTWQAKHDEVIKIGGLYVIGTERHESRRIDNQLRGRSGRQGDPGESRFFVSLEDDLMRIFGGEQISKLMTMLQLPEDQPLSHAMVSRALEQAQVKVEGFNFDTRKHLVEYDDVLNRQREIMYSRRRTFLVGPESEVGAFDELVESTVKEVISSLTANFFAIQQAHPDSEEQELFAKEIQNFYPVELKELKSMITNGNQEDLEAYLYNIFKDQTETKQKIVGDDIWRSVVRSMFLTTVDQFWTKHLTAIDDLREGINLRGYAQMDPLVEYKNEAFRMFESFMDSIHLEFTRRVLHIEINQTPETAPLEVLEEAKEKPMIYKAAHGNSALNGKEESVAEEVSTTVNAPGKKPGRNDSCWCGSGKKYKKCHYPN